MRITYIVARADAIGGASIHIRDLAARMREEGFDARVIVGAGNALTRLLDERHIPYRQIDSLRRDLSPHRDAAAWWRIIRILQEWSPDLVSTHTAKAGLLGRTAARLCGLPVLYTPHCWPFTEGFPRAGFYRRLEKLAAGMTSRFIAVSEFERQQGISAGICRPEDCLTIHNGMPDDDGLRADPSVSPPRLIMVARFETQKDHRTLIAALSGLSDLPWTLSLVGSGPLEGAVRAQVEANGLTSRVTFHGHSDGVAELLAPAQIFVLSTHWESFPRSILEAMRAGLPIVASDIGGCREAVTDGENGFLVRPADPSALREKLKRLILGAELRRAMGERSRQRFEEQFGFENMFKNYLTLYRHFATMPLQDCRLDG